MYPLTWLAVYFLLPSCCIAFYPYQRSASTPHAEGNINAISSRLVVARAQLPSGPLKIPIKRKATRRPGSRIIGSPVKRDNHYTIVTASQPEGTNSLAIDQDGTDFSYFSALKFGSSRKTMYLLIDSGASSTWVMGSDCTTRACQSHNVFGRADSSTLQTTDKTFSLAYGTGTVSGSAASDNVDFGSFLVNVSFGLASDASNDFLSYPIDGILGLGRPSSDPGRYPTVFEAITAERSLESNQFGVHLSATGEQETDGELNFGAPDTSRYDGSLSFTKTISSGPMWDIPLDDAGFDGDMCRLKGRTAIIDTGTSFMLLPPKDAEELHRKIPGFQMDGENFNVPCSTTGSVQLVFSGIKYNVSPADYISKSEAHGDLCPSNIIGKKPFDDNKWLVGDVFLKNVYTVFDFDNSQVGFGVKNGASSSSSSLPLSSMASTSTTSDSVGASTTTTSLRSTTTSHGILLPEGEAAAHTAPSAAAATNPPPSAATQNNTASYLKHSHLLFFSLSFTFTSRYLLL